MCCQIRKHFFLKCDRTIIPIHSICLSFIINNKFSSIINTVDKLNIEHELVTYAGCDLCGAHVYALVSTMWVITKCRTASTVFPP